MGLGEVMEKNGGQSVMEAAIGKDGTLISW